jgi:hypothetical protein
MDLSEEEKRKIYEEERAKIEGEQYGRPVKTGKVRATGGAGEGTQGRNGRIASSSFAIAWGIVLLVFFYFFRYYLAYWQVEDINGTPTWVRYEILTAGFNRWMIILTFTLVIYIIFHIALLIYDRYVLRQGGTVALNFLGVATVASLLAVFPFDFSAIPNFDELIFSLMVRIGLVVILVILIITALVNLIKFIIRLATNTATYQ